MREDFEGIMSRQVEDVEREMVKIRSITDVLVTVDPCELERNTLASLAQIIREAADHIEGCIRSLPMLNGRGKNQ